MAYQLETFADIYTAIREAIGVQSSDATAVNKIKRLVNMYYMNEVVPFKRWTWLQKTLQVVHGAYYNVGTAAVTPASQTVTLSIAPSVDLGSFTGYRFSVDNSNAIYTVSAHTAGSATLTLSLAYQEDINATANFKVWRDRVDLPATAKETIQVTHPQLSVPLKACGPQEFSNYQTAKPKADGFPREYSTDTFYNPSGGLSEPARYRQVRLYPAITATPVTLDIEYVEEAVALDADDDEPIIPLEDRIVLLYGAGAMAWSEISRNEEMHDKWLAKANAKLARMAGERDDGFDTPKMTPDGRYVNSQRNNGIRRRRYGTPASGDTSVSLPTYLKNVTINGGTLTGDLAVSPGVLIDGVDISTLADSSNITQVTLTDGATNAIAAQWALTMDDVVAIDYSITRGSAILEAGSLLAAATSSNTALSQGPTVAIGSAGVTFSTTVSNGNLQLLYTATSTGTNPVLSYRLFKWLA